MIGLRLQFASADITVLHQTEIFYPILIGLRLQFYIKLIFYSILIGLRLQFASVDITVLHKIEIVVSILIGLRTKTIEI